MAVEYFQRLKDRMHKLQHFKLKFKVFITRVLVKQLMYVTLIGGHNIQFYHVWVFVDDQERYYQSLINKK